MSPETAELEKQAAQTLEQGAKPEASLTADEALKPDEAKSEGKVFDPATISPEIKAHFEKQYADYERHKGMSQEYEGLLKTREFQDWYQSLRAPKAPEKFELSDEQFTSALSDKNQFQSLVSRLAESIADQKYGPKIQAAESQLEISRRVDELNKTVAAHNGSDGYPAFMELDKRGLVEPYLRRYPGISFEDAYSLALSKVIGEVVDKKSKGLIEVKKGAGTERPSGSNSGKGEKVRVKTTEEAMEIAFEAAKAGRPEPEFEFE